jgi:hypothetical protein
MCYYNNELPAYDVKDLIIWFKKNGKIVKDIYREYEWKTVYLPKIKKIVNNII